MNLIFNILEEPIKIVDVSPKGIDYGFLLTSLLAIISTGILIWKESKYSIVFGKVISKAYSNETIYTYYISGNQKETIKGQRYILKLSLTCIERTLHYKDVNVYLTYKNNRIKGEIYWTKIETLNTNIPDGRSETFDMITPSDNYLTFNNVLEISKTNFYYLKFIVPNKNDWELYDKMELEFIKPNNKKCIVEVFDIDDKQSFYDEGLIVK